MDLAHKGSWRLMQEVKVFGSDTSEEKEPRRKLTEKEGNEWGFKSDPRMDGVFW